jgi:hypothetical protein
MTMGDLLSRVASLERELRTLRGRVDLIETERNAELGHDPLTWRKRRLRHLFRVYYAGQSRDGAARAIALDWKSYAEGRRNTSPADGSAEDIFAELIAGGCRPLAHRTIFDALDPALDPR